MEDVERISFMFYLNWIDQINELDDPELRRLINNLVNYHKGEKVELETKADRLVWQGILPGLKVNDAKFEKKVAANRANGQLGGAPFGNQNARKEKTTQSTQNNPNNLIIDNRKEIIDKREKEIDNSKELSDNSQLESENWEKSNENRELVIEDVKIEDVFSDTEQVLSSTVKETPADIVKQSGGITMAEYYRRRNQNLK